MPDPTGRTVSASQAAALFNRSPYDTRWTLYQRFIGAIPEDAPDERMAWGKRMQPLLLEAAAEDLALDVRAPDAAGLTADDLFQGDPYLRNGPLGCTKDATVICPDRGPGALELKCCFDYRQWMTRWHGGDGAPLDIEIQLQVQLLVGDGALPFDWGVIGVWVCGEMTYFERKLDDALAQRLIEEATRFLKQVAELAEPDPLGDPVEVPALRALVPEESEADLRGEPGADNAEGRALVEAARLYDHARAEEGFWRKAKESQQAKLLAAARAAKTLLLPGGARLSVKRSQVAAATIQRKASTRAKIDLYLPETPEGEALPVEAFG